MVAVKTRLVTALALHIAAVAAQWLATPWHYVGMPEAMVCKANGAHLEPPKMGWTTNGSQDWGAMNNGCSSSDQPSSATTASTVAKRSTHTHATAGVSAALETVTKRDGQSALNHAWKLFSADGNYRIAGKQEADKTWGSIFWACWTAVQVSDQLHMNFS